ncbi:MAG: YitT family protein [Burkholderiales bacterium]|nr:MAG: YitT family protein [Burkholderiales bacterium]
MSDDAITGEAAANRHSVFDDAQAIVTGALFIALGVALFAQAGLLTGGTAGLAFLIHYATGWRFGVVFFVVNLPFYWLALRTMGWTFTLKTFCAIAALSLFSELMPLVLRFDFLQPVYAGVMGGCLIGAGLLMLFRHRASLGGINVLVLYLQAHRGWRAGKVQMAIDCLIVLAAFALVEPWRIAVSVLGAVALNLVVAVNHRPGRYLGV